MKKKRAMFTSLCVVCVGSVCDRELAGGETGAHRPSCCGDDATAWHNVHLGTIKTGIKTLW